MRKISKGLAVAATVLAIGGASLAAVAQTPGPVNGPNGYGPPGYGPMANGYGPMGYGPMGFMRGRGGYAMMGGGYGMMGGWGVGFTDPTAWLKVLKTELAIRPEQAAAWDAYAKAVRNGATQMQATRGSIDFDKLRTMSWQDRQAYMSKLRDRQAAAFESIQTAKTALLATLDTTQKSHLPSSGQGYSGYGMMGWSGGPRAMGPGYGMMSWGPGSAR